MDYSCYCYISTDPGPALTLVKKHTHHGYWQKHPPKSIPAGTTWAGFRNKDYPGPLGSQGEVVYKTDDGAEFKMTFACPTGEHDNYAAITCTGDACDRYEYYVNWGSDCTPISEDFPEFQNCTPDPNFTRGWPVVAMFMILTEGAAREG